MARRRTSTSGDDNGLGYAQGLDVGQRPLRELQRVPASDDASEGGPIVVLRDERQRADHVRKVGSYNFV